MKLDKSKRSLAELRTASVGIRVGLGKAGTNVGSTGVRDVLYENTRLGTVGRWALGKRS